MILYFSATGNTQYAARRIAEVTGDTLVSIRNCMSKGQSEFHLQKDEDFGVVMPTYFQGMPLFLQEFMENLTLTMEGTEHYAYAAATCGVSYGNFDSEAVRAAGKAGIQLDATFRIRMVDNWNPYFDMTDKEYIGAAEQRAEEDLAEVCASIAGKEKGIYLPDNFDRKQEEEMMRSRNTGG